MSGEREEDLVEARLPEVRCRRRRRRCARGRPRRRPPGRVGAARSQRRRIGVEADGASSARAPARPRTAVRGRAADLDRAEAHRRLELRRRALAITRPRSITAIPSAGWSASSRYSVQSRMVVPSPTRVRMMSQTWLGDRGSRPVVGSSRNIRRGVTRMLAASRGAGASRRVVLDEPPGGLGTRGVDQLVRAVLARAAEAEQRASGTRFCRPLRSSSPRRAGR